MRVADSLASGGRLLANLLHFGRLLRQLGLVVSASDICDLAEGLTHIDLSRRDDFYYTLRSFLVRDRDNLALFDQAFALYWSASQDWALMEFEEAAQAGDAALAQLVLPGDQEAGPDDLVLEDAETEDTPDSVEETRITGTYSAVELLHHKDFACFTEDEMETARRIIESMVWQPGERLTRRQVRASKRAAYLDLPRTIRRSMTHGGEIIAPTWRRRKTKPRPLTVICDISGSMERYSRLFLHFVYALVQGPLRVEAFVFGTRLTRITPALRHSDVDTALDEASALVQDWSGGTRIGESLKAFNFEWSRRVLGRGAVVAIISDGWDRGELDLLEREIGRLQRSIHRLIWLNPLLGAPDYEPLAQGVQVILPHVDDFLPLHNLATLEQLAIHFSTHLTA